MTQQASLPLSTPLNLSQLSSCASCGLKIACQRHVEAYWNWGGTCVTLIGHNGGQDYTARYELQEKPPFWITALKVASLVTLIIPIIMKTAQWLMRREETFSITNQDKWTSCQDLREKDKTAYLEFQKNTKAQNTLETYISHIPEAYQAAIFLRWIKKKTAEEIIKTYSLLQSNIKEKVANQTVQHLLGEHPTKETFSKVATHLGESLRTDFLFSSLFLQRIYSTNLTENENHEIALQIIKELSGASQDSFRTAWISFCATQKKLGQESSTLAKVLEQLSQVPPNTSSDLVYQICESCLSMDSTDISSKISLILDKFLSVKEPTDFQLLSHFIFTREKIKDLNICIIFDKTMIDFLDKIEKNYVFSLRLNWIHVVTKNLPETLVSSQMERLKEQTELVNSPSNEKDKSDQIELAQHLVNNGYIELALLLIKKRSMKSKGCLDIVRLILEKLDLDKISEESLEIAGTLQKKIDQEADNGDKDSQLNKQRDKLAEKLGDIKHCKILALELFATSINRLPIDKQFYQNSLSARTSLERIAATVDDKEVERAIATLNQTPFKEYSLPLYYKKHISKNDLESQPENLRKGEITDQTLRDIQTLKESELPDPTKRYILHMLARKIFDFSKLFNNLTEFLETPSYFHIGEILFEELQSSNYFSDASNVALCLACAISKGECIDQRITWLKKCDQKFIDPEELKKAVNEVCRQLLIAEKGDNLKSYSNDFVRNFTGLLDPAQLDNLKNK